MMLVLHILVALSSLIFSTYLLFKPTSNKLKVSYGLIGATLASGTFLVLADLSHLVSACFTGLIYLSCVFVLNAYVYNKLAAQKSND